MTLELPVIIHDNPPPPPPHPLAGEWAHSTKFLFREALSRLDFHRLGKKTQLKLEFCFPNSDHVMFSREFAFCLFINYAYMCRWI